MYVYTYIYTYIHIHIYVPAEAAFVCMRVPSRRDPSRLRHTLLCFTTALLLLYSLRRRLPSFACGFLVEEIPQDWEQFVARHQESCVCVCVCVVFVCVFCALCVSREDWEQFVRGAEASLSTFFFSYTTFLALILREFAYRG